MSYLGFDSSCASTFHGDTKAHSTHAIPAKKKVLPIAGRRNRIEILLPIEPRRSDAKRPGHWFPKAKKSPLGDEWKALGRNILPTGFARDKCLAGFGLPQGRRYRRV